VEGLVGYARRNFLVPVPRCSSWQELNGQLIEQCRKRRERRLRGHEQTIGERFQQDAEALLPLPPAPYEACEKRTTRVTSLSLVRYRNNDDSVPTAYGHREVLIKGYVPRVVICSGSQVIAQLRRLLETRLSKRGKREFVQVLRLLETFPLVEVTHAAGQALHLGTLFDAVKHLLLCHIERRPPRLDLDSYPHLPLAQVGTTAAADYSSLLPGAAV
jgi:hypothetical protein